MNESLHLWVIPALPLAGFLINGLAGRRLSKAAVNAVALGTITLALLWTLRVFAAAQGGLHENGRETFGHSLVVDPWGRVLAEGGIEPGVILARIDPAEVTVERAKIPSLQHAALLAGGLGAVLVVVTIALLLST